MWLKEGDRNSKFFHLSTLLRRRRNCIAEIKMADRTWIYNGGEIEDYFATHFQEVFQSFNPPIPPSLDNLLEPCITREENAELSRIPTSEEV